MAKLLSTTALAALAMGAPDPYTSSNTQVQSAGNSFVVGGACDIAGGIDGMTFVKEGVTRNGSPYFKALGTQAYLYYDADCEGGSEQPNRWIFDTEKPDLSKMVDLDNDLACQYLASTDSADGSRPPTTGTWMMYCDGVEEEHYLTLRDSSMPYGGTTPVPGSRGFYFDGACPLKGFLNGKFFEEVGTSADGRPFFKAVGGDEHIYYDADCDGSGSTNSARWVIDNGRPSTLAVRDLDQDSKCDYHARLDGNSQRPLAGNWRMYCGAAMGWADVQVTLRESVSTSRRAVNAAQRGGLTALAVAALAVAGATAFGF